MNPKLRRFATALLPMCSLSAQRPAPKNEPPNQRESRPPSPKALRRAAESRQRLRAQAIPINELAGNIQSPDDARKLVDRIAREISAPKWVSRFIRERIARAEYESAAVPGALIPEQHVADAWNDYLQKIGAPQESYVTAAEVHTLRDSYYVSTQLSWARGNQHIWTIPNIYAVGLDGKVTNGCRALEALNILLKLANDPEVLEGTRSLIKNGQLLSDTFKNPTEPPAPATEKCYVRLRMSPPNPVRQAGLRYVHDNGVRALDRAIEALLTDMFAG